VNFFLKNTKICPISRKKQTIAQWLVSQMILKSTGMIVVHDIDIHHENGAPSMCNAHPLINATRRTHVFLEKTMSKKL
jgi:hypothetical protein